MALLGWLPPTGSPLPDDWTKLITDLDPNRVTVPPSAAGGGQRPPGEPPTITIPGWDQIIKTGRPIRPGREAWQEFFRARRERREPRLSPAERYAIEQRIMMREANARSAQPAWSASWGQMMTALDNVQDFLSAMASLGRFLLWSGVPLANKLLPGVSPAMAQLLARQAGNAAAIATEAELRALAIFNREFIDAAARRAASDAFARALRGGGTKIAARLIPGIGWILLANDLLNLLGLLGMTAFPLYALLCSGPRDALLAGVPALILKNALCKEVWTQALRNPFSRTARAARHMRALGRLPTVGGWIEIAQTTDTLWGYGLSLGALYGAAMESLFSLAANPGNRNVQINTDLLQHSTWDKFFGKAKAMDPAQTYLHRAAARTLATAPALQGKSDLLTDEAHYDTLAAILGALPFVASFWDEPETPEVMELALASQWRAPLELTPAWAPLLEEHRTEPAGLGTWWIPGNPRSLPGDVLVPQLADQVVLATTEFLYPRRNTEPAVFAGSVMTQVAEQLWHMVSQDRDAIRFELTPDYKLLTSLMVEGLFPRLDEDEAKIWRWWLAARALSDARGGELLYRDDWARLADDAGIDLLRALPPDAPWPAIWAEWRDHPERFPASS